MSNSRIICGIVLLLLVNSCFSWNEVGHLLVCSVTAKDLVARNLSKVLDKATEIVLNGAKYSPNMTQTFEGTSIWADEIRFLQNVSNFDEMHYFDMIYNPNGILIKNSPPLPNALQFINKTLAAYKATKNGPLTWEKTFMLRMLIHIVGDMHQPLHMSALFSEQFPNGDEGGNYGKISFNYEPHMNTTNFHSYWDSGAGKFPSFPQRPLPQENLTYISDFANELIANNSRASLAANLSEKSVDKWGQGMFNISRDYVYPPMLNNNRVITQEYTNDAYDRILKLITLAGYRLSDMLETMFASTEMKNDHEHHMIEKKLVKLKQDRRNNLLL